MNEMKINNPFQVSFNILISVRIFFWTREADTLYTLLSPFFGDKDCFPIFTQKNLFSLKSVLIHIN